jgi:hypothetical protein
MRNRVFFKACTVQANREDCYNTMSTVVQNHPLSQSQDKPSHRWWPYRHVGPPQILTLVTGKWPQWCQTNHLSVPVPQANHHHGARWTVTLVPSKLSHSCKHTLTLVTGNLPHSCQAKLPAPCKYCGSFPTNCTGMKEETHEICLSFKYSY